MSIVIRNFSEGGITCDWVLVVIILEMSEL